MTGELWLATHQMGLESVAGTAVAASRKMYFSPESVLSAIREPRVHEFATGTRSQARAYTQGPQAAGGLVSLPLSASEIIELLLIGLKGGVTPTNPAAGVDLWTFVPDSTALASATVEWNDGARGLQLAGCRANTIRIAGNANGENTVTAELFGTDLTVEAITGGLADRAPDFIEGWESKLYVDAYGGTPGGTLKSDLMINWDILFSNNLGRKKWANNTSFYDAVITGKIGVEAKVLIEAANAQAVTEYANWIAETLRLLRFEFGQNDVISDVYKKFVTIDIAGAWSAFDLGQTDAGTRAYALSLAGIYDTTNTFDLQVRCQNARDTAWDSAS